MVDLVVWAHRSRADEQIPIQCFGDLVYFGRTHQALWPDRTVGKGIHAGYFTDFAVPDPVAHLTNTFARCTLVTHLRCDVVFLGQFGQQT